MSRRLDSRRVSAGQTPDAASVGSSSPIRKQLVSIGTQTEESALRDMSPSSNQQQVSTVQRPGWMPPVGSATATSMRVPTAPAKPPATAPAPTKAPAPAPPKAPARTIPHVMRNVMKVGFDLYLIVLTCASRRSKRVDPWVPSEKTASSLAVVARLRVGQCFTVRVTTSRT